MSTSLITASLPLTDSLTPRHGQCATGLYRLEDLVQDIKLYLGGASGIDSADIDSSYLISLATKYASNLNDWAKYFYNDPSKNYTRNAIENINQKANILLLVWNPGKGSPIHDHANAHCIMKILAGELSETVYHPPEGANGVDAPLKMKHSKTYKQNEVTYICDDIGLHRVHNPSPDHIAVSLHLYTPPNAADYGYNIFDAASGKAKFVPQAQSRSNETKL